MLAWLLGEDAGTAVGTALEEADLVVTSDLTLLECARALHRAVSSAVLIESESARLNATLRRLSGHWVLVRIDEDVLHRASKPFPIEPVRTLDAIHLATAVSIMKTVGEVKLLSLDRRILENGRALGFEVQP